MPDDATPEELARRLAALEAEWKRLLEGSRGEIVSGIIAELEQELGGRSKR
jgi:hypothetical protein